MKETLQLIGAWLLATSLVDGQLWAQASGSPPATPDNAGAAVDTATAAAQRQRAGRIILPDKAGVLTVDNPLRLLRPGQSPLPPEVRDRVRSFEQYRTEYLRQQEDLRRLLQTTTDQDRERIRERFQELRTRWREQSLATRQELSERRRELLDRLGSHRELLEQAREEAQQNLRERRERRGVEP